MSFYLTKHILQIVPFSQTIFTKIIRVNIQFCITSDYYLYLFNFSLPTAFAASLVVFGRIAEVVVAFVVNSSVALPDRTSILRLFFPQQHFSHSYLSQFFQHTQQISFYFQ